MTITIRHYDDQPIRLTDCPPGLFLFNGTLCLKSEYSTHGSPDAYVVESGEYFWGGTDDRFVRDALLVTPLDLYLKG